MNPERWARVTDVFRAVLERPAGERAAFLDNACDGDEALRRDVEKLLAGEAEPSLPSPLPELLAGSAMDLASGEMLAHYRVEAKSGEGGMGAVYRAYDTRLHRQVALKVLPPDAVADPDRVGRLMREARAASALNHPNIVTIYEIGSDRGVDFIAMELVSGKTLARLTGRRGLPLRDALQHAVQTASALAAAHGAGIVHRDLKPANIMVNDAGQVKVLDFGLAKRTERAVSGETGSTYTMGPETDTGAVLGTTAYMSPEQAEGKRLDVRSDIFSFGVVLYEMVTGKRAFERDSTAATLAAILKEEPQPPGELAGGLPPDLEKILARCLRKDPERRFQHMSDLKVALEELKEESDSGRPAPPRPVARRRRRALGWAAVALAILAGVSLGVRFLRSRTETPAGQLRAVPLTSDLGDETQPSLSPDGTRVAFCWRRENQNDYDIYVKVLDAGTALRLTDNPANETGPAWSPDGQRIAFYRRSGGQAGIFSVSPTGGSERKLAGLTSGPTALGRLSWSPDGRSLALEEWHPSESRFHILLLSIETGERRPLTANRPDSGQQTSPAFSPDGRRVAFFQSPTTTNEDVYVVPVAGGNPRRLSFDGGGARGLAWTPDGREIVFSLTRDQSSRLWSVPASGGSPPRLAWAAENASFPSISRQGRLVFARSLMVPSIWRAEVHGPERHPVRLIASTAGDDNPAWSPDGKRIAFNSNRSGAGHIWVCDSEGSNPVQLTTAGRENYWPSWSPDGRQIAFNSNAKGNWDIYAINSEGGAIRSLTAHSSNNTRPSWSPDGRWIYFHSDRSGSDQVWRMRADGGSQVQVTKEGGWNPLVSPDGRFVYYVKERLGESILRVPAGGGEEKPVLGHCRRAGAGNWAVVAGGIYFADWVQTAGAPFFSRAPGAIKFFDLETRRATDVLPLEKALPAAALSVSPDGRYFLYAQADQLGSDLALVENFR